MEEYHLYDKNNIPILPGDTLKVFHYIARLGKEKRYMFKWAQKVIQADGNYPLLKISHLNLQDGCYYEIMNNRVLKDYEIVQGYAGVECGQDYRDRRKK